MSGWPVVVVHVPWQVSEFRNFCLLSVFQNFVLTRSSLWLHVILLAYLALHCHIFCIPGRLRAQTWALTLHTTFGWLDQHAFALAVKALNGKLQMDFKYLSNFKKMHEQSCTDSEILQVSCMSANNPPKCQRHLLNLHQLTSWKLLFGFPYRMWCFLSFPSSFCPFFPVSPSSCSCSTSSCVSHLFVLFRQCYRCLARNSKSMTSKMVLLLW